jgi:hypothetical protein
LRGDWVNVGEGYNNHNNVGRGTTTTDCWILTACLVRRVIVRRLVGRRREVQQLRRRVGGYNNNFMRKLLLYRLGGANRTCVKGSELGTQIAVEPYGACGNWCCTAAPPSFLQVEERRGGKGLCLTWKNVLLCASARSRTECPSGW